MTARADPPAAIHAFEAIGVEIEYMIVDRRTLDVRPLAERLLETSTGEIESEIEHGPIALSNELVAHVVELKTNGPAPSLAPLADRFAAEVVAVNEQLAAFDACLLPTGMHPWMDPDRETTLWRYGDRSVYETFDRIFDCRGHGWANLQSAHLNFPFADDREFARVHAAIRAVLPLLPALAASSPFVDGAHRGAFDERLRAYATNAKRIPSLAGEVVPEPVYSRADYERLLQGLYDDLAADDPEGILRHEWVNARGAIARFDRGAIEIRLLDAQECPRADLALAHGVWHLVRSLASPERFEELAALPTGPLAELLREVADHGGAVPLRDERHRAALGLAGSPSVGEALGLLLESSGALGDEGGQNAACLRALLRRGSLAEALVRRLGSTPERAALHATYTELAQGLQCNEPFALDP